MVALEGKQVLAKDMIVHYPGYGSTGLLGRARVVSTFTTLEGLSGLVDEDWTSPSMRAPVPG